MHTLRVWDLPTRLFHWLLAASVSGMVVTGKLGGNFMTWHLLLGHVVLALLLFFVGEKFIESGCAPETWAIRLRHDTAGLIPREQPLFRDDAWIGKGFEARWLAPQQDHPCYDDGCMRLPEGMPEFPDDAHGLCSGRTKLGGYARSLQHEIAFLPAVEDEDSNWQPSPHEPEYLLQIDSEAKAGLNWVDGGIVYLGRNPATGQWSAHCQFY